MEYITSRKTLPPNAAELESGVWFNMWSRRKAPLGELLEGDTLYWYDTTTKTVRWKSEIRAIESFPYSSKADADRQLKQLFGSVDTDHPYFVKAPEQGYCMAWRVGMIQPQQALKSEGKSFPQQGWIRVDESVAREWFGRSMEPEPLDLDSLAPSAGDIWTLLDALNGKMAGILPTRVESIIWQTIRRDTAIVKALKAYHDYHCQFPGCVVRIATKGGGYYAEVAHIKAVARDGQSVLGNLLVLCPNHHREFDCGDLKIGEQSADRLSGTLNGTTFKIPLGRGPSMGS